MTNENRMTRKEAIDFGKMWLDMNKDAKDSSTYTFFQMAIQALEQQPTLDTRQRERQLEMEYQHGYDKGWEEGRKALEQQPSEDCISRAEVLNFLKGFETLHNHDELRSNLIDGIMNLPFVTPTRPKSKWNYINEHARRYRVCSNCGYTKEDDKFYSWYFCPKCGADMRESKKDACKDCYYNDGEVHAECVICDKAESEKEGEE